MQNHYEPSGNIPTWLISTKYTANNGVIGLTFTPNAIRSHAITITATDDYGQSATTTWTIDAVPAEIEASFTGGGGQIYLGFTTNLSLYINKPHYAGQYNVSYSISGASGSLSQQPAQVNNGSTTRMTYTPKAKGTHIITVDIRDSEGKTKKLTQAVFVVLPTMTTTSTPGMFGIRLIHSERERKFYNPYEQINLT